jgi:hypothetical protein
MWSTRLGHPGINRVVPRERHSFIESTYLKSNKEAVEWFIVRLVTQQNHTSAYVNATD